MKKNLLLMIGMMLFSLPLIAGKESEINSALLKLYNENKITQVALNGLRSKYSDQDVSGVFDKMLGELQGRLNKTDYARAFSGVAVLGLLGAFLYTGKT